MRPLSKILEAYQPSMREKDAEGHQYIAIVTAEEVAYLIRAGVLSPQEGRRMVRGPDGLQLGGNPARIDASPPARSDTPQPSRTDPLPAEPVYPERVYYKGKPYKKLSATRDGKRVQLGTVSGKPFPDGKMGFWIDAAALLGT
jgi:hypothetical protein